MKKHYLFLAKSTSLLQDAQNEALHLGLEDLYVIQEINKERWLLGGTTAQILPDTLEHLEISSLEQSVDWKKQSALFSPYFLDGKIRVPLKEFFDSEAILELEPGSGFGDMSHPTTRLTLQSMASRCKDSYVVDIGCGNGVLSLAAVLMGAVYVNGIDIDPDALIHANRNKLLSNFSNVDFSLKPTPRIASHPSLIALMNMTFLEQKMAWNSLSSLHGCISTIVTSGILIEQKEKYLAWAEENQWKLVSESEEDVWACFIFNNIPK